MDNDLTRFLTEGETKQISEIISRAEKRKKGRGEEDTHFMALHCQFEQYEHGAFGVEPSDDEVKQMLREVCMKCCEHGCCHFIGNKEVADLPFPKDSDEKHKEEIRRAVKSGKLSMLFSLVHSGKLTMEEAEMFSGYDIEETHDMYEGWKMAQEM